MAAFASRASPAASDESKRGVRASARSGVLHSSAKGTPAILPQASRRRRPTDFYGPDFGARVPAIDAAHVASRAARVPELVSGEGLGRDRDSWAGESAKRETRAKVRCPEPFRTATAR